MKEEQPPFSFLSLGYATGSNSGLLIKIEKSLPDESQVQGPT